MRVITHRASRVEGGGSTIASARGKGVGNKATTVCQEWRLTVTNDKGNTVARQNWWQMTDVSIEGSRIRWTNGVQRLAVSAPLSADVIRAITTATSATDMEARYRAALNAARAADRQETQDLATAKATKAAKGDASLQLTASQSRALRNDRNRKLGIVGGVTFAVALIALVVVIFATSSQSENTPADREESTNCTWKWVPGKAPADVGWDDAVQYCYPD